MNYIAARRQEEKTRRRADILDAAEQVAAAEGLEALTMEDVARQARLSRALLYVYFRDKLDLQDAMAERALRELHARFVAAVAAHPRGVDQLVAMGRAYVAFGAEAPVQFDVLARCEARAALPTGEDDDNAAAVLQAGARVHALMIDSIRAGIGDGSIAPDAGDPGTVAVTLWGLMHGVCQILRMKAGALAYYGIAPEALVEQALALARSGLATRTT